MENDRQYQFTTCPKDGSAWLEELHEYYATRWEPGGVDVDEQPCPVCGPEGPQPLYGEETWYGLLAYAVLDAARSVAYAVECLGLPPCSDCGHTVDEFIAASRGAVFCWACYEKRYEEDRNQP